MKEGMKYPCNMCQAILNSKTYLYDHIKSVHQGIRYQCNQCQYKATLNNSMNEHIKVKHEGMNEISM